MLSPVTNISFTSSMTLAVYKMLSLHSNFSLQYK